MKSLTRGHIKAGLDSVRGTKLRNFWTMLGVIIGVASVISVVGIGEGIKHQVTAEIRQSGTNVITIRPSELHISGGSNGGALSVLSGLNIAGNLTSHDQSVIAATPGVATSVPLSAMTGRIKGDGGSYASGLVIGTEPGLGNLLNQSLSSGSFLSSAPTGVNPVVLGSHAAATLFNEGVPLGDSLTIDGQQFIVAGVFNEFPNVPLNQDADFNNAVFIPYSDAQSLSGNTASTYEILAKAHTVSQTAAVTKAVQQRLLSAHGGQNDFSVVSQNQDVSNNNAVVNLLTRLIGSIAAISLIVGGIGIMNVMLVSVAERLHEIGIRKALGATDRQILSQFMIEATMLSLMGGAIGIVVAFVIDLALRIFTDLQPEISWQVVVLSVVVSLLVGIIFGSFPAYKAARKPPIEALRSE